MIRKEQQAMKALQAQERLFQDNLVRSHNWLGEFQWTGEPERLPLEVAAATWFHIASDPGNAGPYDGPQGPWVDHILAQMDARCQQLNENWNHRWAQQQAEWRRVVDRLEEQKEELKRELHIVRQEKEDLMRDVERLRNPSEQPEPKILDVDEAILAIEVEQDLVEAETRGLDADRPEFEQEERAHGVEATFALHGALQAFQTSNAVVNMSPASGVQRSRRGLPVRHTVISNRSKYPPTRPMNLSGGRKRDSTSNTRPRSTSRDSHASSLATDTTLVNSISSSSPQVPNTAGHSRPKSTSRAGSQDRGVTTCEPGTSDSFQRGNQQGYDPRLTKTSRRRSSSSGREYEDAYQTLPSPQYGASTSVGHESSHPQVHVSGRQYDSQPLPYMPQYLPPLAQRGSIPPRRQTSYQGSAPLNFGRWARV